ncbi:hypothetical protein AB1E18_019670 [Capra hircus]
MLRMAGTLQPPVVTPGEDATLFRVEAGEDGEAQVDGVVAGIRQGFYLLTEDIFEDVEVVPDEEQQQGSSLELQKSVEEQCQERPGGPSELPALDVLQALATLQGDLSSEPEKTCRAYVWFTCKSHERRKRDLAQKSAIIQGIPGFWANVVSFLLLPVVRCSGGGGGSTEELGVVPGARGLRRPFRELACPTPVGRKAAGEQSPPRLERGEGETSLRPGGPATRSLLRARGPSPAAPPSKASCK